MFTISAFADVVVQPTSRNALRSAPAAPETTGVATEDPAEVHGQYNPAPEGCQNRYRKDPGAVKSIAAVVTSAPCDVLMNIPPLDALGSMPVELYGTVVSDVSRPLTASVCVLNAG
jgi:hypothetical protein